MPLEGEWLDAMHCEVSAGLQQLPRYLSDIEVRSSLEDALGHFAEYASTLIRAFDTALAAESEEHVRQVLVDSKKGLTASDCGCLIAKKRCAESTQSTIFL